MKALSIKQPWASLIGIGIKPIENRTWRTKYRGKVLIHASAKGVPNFDFTQQQTDALATVDTDNLEMPYSAIIGEVDIIDCVINHPSIWAEKTDLFKANSKDYPDKIIYNWVLANAVFYDKPILNVKGKLSFWEPDIIIQECIGCSQKFNYEEMEEDDAGERYCLQCWEVLSPIMAEEARKNEETE